MFARLEVSEFFQGVAPCHVSRIVGQVARIGYSQTGPLTPEGSDDVFRDLVPLWDELGGDAALRVQAYREVARHVRNEIPYPIRTVA